jgi:predicted ATPase/signal transduction histidine kinase/CheY-like chemotaxis protein
MSLYVSFFALSAGASAIEGGGAMPPGGYAEVERLGDGTWTTLYRAVRSGDAQSILLEVLNPEHCHGDLFGLLAKPLEIATALGSAPVLTPLGMSTFEGRPALEVEDTRATPLDSSLAAPWPVGAFLDLAIRLTSAVADLHERGIVHGALQPRYILLDRETGAVELSGFWYAQRATREGTVRRPAVLVEGFLPYVSPEQTGRLNRSVDRRSDLYSLGIIFFELLTARRPYAAQDAVGWVHCHLAHRPPAPHELVSSIPRVLSDIVLELIEKAPEERYQSTAGLLQDLRRCQAALRATGQIAAFPLERADVSDVFTIPQKLYGRDQPRTQLLEQFERIASGAAPSVVFVSGSAGVGKSSLVHELQRPSAIRGGRFVAGKFDQYKREIPYAAVVDALRELALDVLADSRLQIAEYRRRISAALGANAALVCVLIPQVSLLLEAPPPPLELPPAEIEKRLQNALRRLVGALASREHPLVMFLDDLQWVDAASMEFLVDLVSDPALRYLLIVAAYRDGEIGPLHPLRRGLDRLAASGAALKEISLRALPLSDLAQLVSELASVPYPEALPLAQVIHDKTAGNPFFVVQLLSELHRRALFCWEPPAQRWSWNLPAILAHPCSDNVTDLLVAKLRELSAECQAALSIGAHLGGEFDLDALAIALEGDPGLALNTAVDHGLLLTLDRKYRFAHDRVHEAAYFLISESEHAATHLRIGRLLLASTPPGELSARSFDLASHLNLGGSLLTSALERERVAELNLTAGRRARGSGAHASARSYFAAGSALLLDDAWERGYELAFALGLAEAECELATGELAAAEQRLARLATRARGFIDQAAVVRAQAKLSMMRGEFARAMDSLLEVLRRVAIDWSPRPSEDCIRGEYQRLRVRIGARPIESLIELGAADASTQAIMETLSLLVDVTSNLDDRLMQLAVCRMAKLSLDRGLCDASSLAFVNLGQILGPYFDEYDMGFRFARLGLRLIEQRRQSRFSESALVVAGAFVYPWTQPFDQALALLRRGFDTSLENGAPMLAWVALAAETSLRYLSGDPLADVDELAQRAADLGRKAKLGTYFDDMVVGRGRLIRALRGLTRRFPCFDDEDFEESRFEAHLAANPALRVPEGWYWIRKLQACHLGGDYAGALAAGRRAEALLWTTGFALERVEYHLYRALALAAHFEESAAEQRPQQRAALVEHVRALEARGRDCPANFGASAALAGAELARIDGDSERAAQGYEQSIGLSRDAGRVWLLALAYETAERFYRKRGFALIADTYLHEACDAYRRWGANGKLRQLEERHPSLALRGTLTERALLGVRSEQLDLLAVVQASQTISGMVFQDQLLETLLRIVLAQGGARRARLVLVRDESDAGELRVAAEACVADAASLLEPTPRVPTSIIEYVRRTGLPVLLDDAAADAGRFASDAYLARARPRAALCLPVRHHGTLVGMLYLDNDLTPGVFTPERLVALELLATQAAVSLQNAELVARERAAREEAEVDRRRALLLGEATALLAASSDPATLSEVVRRVCEHGLADWGVLDAMQGGAIQRVACAHRAAAKQPLLADLQSYRAASFAGSLAAKRVLETGAAVHEGSLSEEQLREYCADAEQAALARQLGSRSLLIVPLVARGAQLGALSLMAASPHHFQPRDVALAVELGRRLGMAIESTRLAELESRLLQSQKMEAIGHLAGGVAHDFNNLLCVILSYSRLGRERLPPADPLREDLEEMERAGERGAALTRQLLAFSRHQLVEPRAVDLNQVVGEVRVMLATLLGSRVVLTFQPSERLWRARADPGQLEQVLMNLAANARDAMPRGGTLLISTSNVELDAAYVSQYLGVVPGEYVMLAMTDTGCGIAREIQARIFEPFFTTKQRGEGTGLGLATVFGIVRQSGGHVAVDSEVGRGTTFRVYLRRCAEYREDVVASPAPAPTSGRGSETILLVEDDEQVRGAARTILENHGYKVLVATGPGDALLTSEQYPEPIDLLLSDVAMPRMTGPELAERVIAARPGIRILFLSGYTGTPIPRLSLGDDRADFLQKPFTPDTLTQSIRKLLQAQPANGTQRSG